MPELIKFLKENYWIILIIFGIPAARLAIYQIRRRLIIEAGIGWNPNNLQDKVLIINATN